MKEIAAFGNTYQTEKGTQLKRIFALLEQIHARVSIDAELYTFLKEQNGITPEYHKLITDNDFSAEVALSIGGDGTFLRTAERVGDKCIPILGINTGRLGFLAYVSVNDIDNAMTEIYKNSFSIEERTLLYLEIFNSEDGLEYKSFALNEIALLKRDISSMINIQVDINGSLLNAYEADGIIIATPTGSTAYSLSVGGPLLAPQASNFVISPVAPHSLTTRPLVITDDSVLDIKVQNKSIHSSMSSFVICSKYKMIIPLNQYKLAFLFSG